MDRIFNDRSFSQTEQTKIKFKQRARDLDALDRAAIDVMRCLSELEKAESDVDSLERSLSTTGSTKTPNDVQREMQEKDKEV